MNILSRDSLSFTIKRDSVEKCIVYIRQPYFYIFSRWTLFIEEPTEFIECLQIIKDHCCMHNIGTAKIYDSQGANTTMIINYRRYKGEKLNKHG